MEERKRQRVIDAMDGMKTGMIQQPPQNAGRVKDEATAVDSHGEAKHRRRRRGFAGCPIGQLDVHFRRRRRRRFCLPFCWPLLCGSSFFLQRWRRSGACRRPVLIRRRVANGADGQEGGRIASAAGAAADRPASRIGRGSAADPPRAGAVAAAAAFLFRVWKKVKPATLFFFFFFFWLSCAFYSRGNDDKTRFFLLLFF